MEITQHSREGRLELQLNGRFDANWADHVGNVIESAIRAGQHHIDLDLGQVNYISSAGLRIVVKYFKQLRGIKGALRVLRPTENVLSVLELSGIANLLVAAPGTPEQHQGGTGRWRRESATTGQPQAGTQRWVRNSVTFESHALPGARSLDCRLHGHPE